jgi:hypothetical protein
MPPNTIYVGRPGRWGNPFKKGTREDVVKAYTILVNTTILGERAKQELRGKNLACWCAVGIPCHADVLLKVANE